VGWIGTWLYMDDGMGWKILWKYGIYIVRYSDAFALALEEGPSGFLICMGGYDGVLMIPN